LQHAASNIYRCAANCWLYLRKNHMTKISVALATVLVLAAASSNVAFAAMPKAHQVQTQDDQTQAVTAAYSKGTQHSGDYGDPWAVHSPMSDGRPSHS
jgi:hypothetical protein